MDSSDDNCYLISENKTKVYKTLCSVILEKNGPLSNCHNSINPETYYKSCVQKLCYFSDNDKLHNEIVVSSV